MKLTLPYPPYTNNEQYIHTKQGRVILHPKVRAFRSEAGWLAKGQGARPIEGTLEVWIVLFRRNPKGDADGPIKQLFDALNKIAWKDDSQIKKYHVEVQDDPSNPRVELDIQEIGDISPQFSTKRQCWHDGGDCTETSICCNGNG